MHVQPNPSLSQSSSKSLTSKNVRGSRFTMKFKLKVYDQQDASIDVKKLILLWNKRSNYGKKYTLKTMLLIQQKNLLNEEIYECRLDYNSVVHGFTESLKNKNNLYRAHPDYRNTGEWFDWAFISWIVTLEDGSSSFCLITAQLLMFIYISECTVMSVDKYENSDISNEINVLGLKEHDYWEVVQSANKYPSLDTNVSKTSSPFDTHK